MPDIKELQSKFIKADDAAKAGNLQAAEDARIFAAELKRLQTPSASANFSPAPASTASANFSPAPASTAKLYSEDPSMYTMGREMLTGAGATTAGQMIGTALLPGVGTAIGGAIGGGVGNLTNQIQRMAEDPNYEFRWGELLADVGTSAIPGSGVVKAGIKPILKEATKQGVAGAAATTVQSGLDKGELPSAKELAIGTALPAVVGGGVQAVLPKLPGGRVESVPGVTPQKIRTLEEGQAKGLSVLPTTLDPSFSNKQLESFGGAVASKRQVQQANAEKVPALIREELDLVPDADGRVAELSPGLLKQLRKDAGEAYNVIDEIQKKAKTELDQLEKARAQIDLEPDPKQREILLDQYDQQIASNKAILETQAAADVKKLRELRGESQKNFDKYYNSGGKNVEAQTAAYDLKDQAKQLELDIEDAMRKAGFEDAANNLQRAREKIAKTYNVEEAMNFGDFSIDPGTFAKQLDRGVPLSGNLKLLGQFKLAFRDSLADPTKIPAPGVSNVSSILQTVMGVGAFGGTEGLPLPARLALSGAATVALPVGREMARKRLLSPSVQESLSEAISPKLFASPEAAAAGTAAKQLGQEAGRTEVRPITKMDVDYLRSNPNTAKQFDEKFGAGTSAKWLTGK